MHLNRPKILCVIDSLERGGGAEQLLVDLLPAMKNRGMDIEVAALFRRPADLAPKLEQSGITVHRLNLAGPFSLLDATRKLRALVRSNGFDAFWGHLYYGNFYASLAGHLAGHGPVVVTIHSEGYSKAPPKRVRGRIAVQIERFVLHASDLCVAVSEAVRRDYAAYFGLGNIKVVHNGIDCRGLQAFLPVNRESVRAGFGFSSDDFLIVTPATFVAKKGHGIWLDAIQHLRDTHNFMPKVMLCGDGPLFETIALDAARRGLAGQVKLSPVIPHEKLFPLMVSSDAVVLPSLREPFGIAAAEAMALGAACVLTDVDGFRELTKGADCALLVPAGDPLALADAIDRLQRNPNFAAELGKRAKAHVCATFDITPCASRWSECFERAIATSTNRVGPASSEDRVV